MCGTNFHIQNEMINTIKMYMYHNAGFERQQSAVDFRSGNDEFWLVDGMVDIETRRPEGVRRHENVVPLCFSGAVYRNAVKFTYIGYNLILFRTVLVSTLV